MTHLWQILGVCFTYVPVLIKIMTPSKHLSIFVPGHQFTTLDDIFFLKCYMNHSVQCNRYFLIHRRQENDLRCSSQASMYSNVSTVDLLFNFLSQGLGDNTLLAFKDDSILYASSSLRVKYLETSFGTELLFLGHPLGSLF